MKSINAIDLSSEDSDHNKKIVGKFMIRKTPSIFTDRHPKLDIVIHVETGASWGALYDGTRYTIAMILKSENMERLRSNFPVPDDIIDNLKSWGF